MSLRCSLGWHEWDRVDLEDNPKLIEEWKDLKWNTDKLSRLMFKSKDNLHYVGVHYLRGPPLHTYTNCICLRCGKISRGRDFAIMKEINEMRRKWVAIEYARVKGGLE